jgi:hypothetical protein
LIFSPRTHGSQILLVKRRCGSLEQSIGPARAVGGTCMKKRRAGRDVVALWQPSALARPAPPRAVASLFQIPSDLSGPTPSELGAGSWLPGGIGIGRLGKGLGQETGIPPHLRSVEKRGGRFRQSVDPAFNIP